MKQFICMTLIALLFGCNHSDRKRTSVFSEEQILSLCLDSTLNIKILQDSVIKLNFNKLLDNRDFDFHEVLSSVKYLPLETTPDCLIGGIKSIVLSDSNIFILDDFEGGSVLIFDKNGKFIGRIVNGQGPGEIAAPKCIAFDPELNELIVFHHIYFSIFSPNGEFLRRETVPLGAHAFAKTKDGYLFQSVFGVFNEHIGMESKTNQIFLTDRNFKLISTGFRYKFDEMNFFNSDQFLSPNTSQIDFFFALVDTVYQYVDNKTVRAKYYFDISKHTFPEKFLLKADFGEVSDASKENDYFMFEGNFSETKDHLYVRFSNRKRLYMSVFFVDKNSWDIKGGTNFYHPAEMYPGIGLPITSTDSCFISCIYPYHIMANLDKLQPSEYLSEEEVSILKKIKEDDNPVLMFYELKDF
jgi:hypothetical protein